MYNDFYGFSQAPFSTTPDPHFLFFSDGHREAFDHLSFGVQERKGFIQITGEVGAGKTTIHPRKTDDCLGLSRELRHSR